MALSVTAISPEVAGSRGGELVTLTGTFDVGVEHGVKVGGIDAYSGVSGQGNAIYSADGTTIQFVLPPMAAGGTTSVLVTAGVDQDGWVITIVEDVFGSVPFSLRSSCPPWYDVGPRRLELEASAVLPDTGGGGSTFGTATFGTSTFGG